jgi:hypothetical protein
MVLSVADVLNATSITLGRTNTKYGNDIAIGLIKKELNDYILFVGQDINESAKSQVCELILSNYPNYLLETIKLAFLRIKSGRYGKIYGAVNGAVIMDFFKLFDIELDEEIVQIKKLESDKNKKDYNFYISKPITNDEEINEAYRKMREDIKKISKDKDLIKNTDHKLNDTQTSQLTNENHKLSGSIIQEWIKEFDDLFAISGDNTKAVKFVDYKEFRVTLLEFLDLKQKEFNDEQELIEKI